MNSMRHHTTLAWLTSAALTTCLCAGVLPTNRVHAQSELQTAQFGRTIDEGGASSLSDDNATQTDRVSPDLRAKMKAAIARDEFETLADRDELVSVVIQLKRKISGKLNNFLSIKTVSEKGRFSNLYAIAIQMKLSDLKQLSEFKEVAYVSVDRDVEMHGHVETTSGAAAARAVLGNSGIDGTGIGIAVLDSGIWCTHRGFFDAGGKLRVVKSVDFMGSSAVGAGQDPFGHGTHVANLAAGSAAAGASSAYTGIAPNAKLINLRVLDSQGKGTTSTVLNALDWVMTNRTTYNIRVVNMSLGCLAVDSYVNDPLCRAVRKLVDAGVVCVVAAGNNGKDSNGDKVYGLIHSPGNEPSAITVGATNTYGTDARSDDTIATYSSRGPTRSYWTDSQGVNHYDNLIKPDLVAPGNKLYSAEADKNNLLQSYPTLDNAIITNHTLDQMTLSGTSMATPVVAGAAALLLQVDPYLTPNMVKAILMYTAQPLPGFNQLEQGAGEVNIEGAVRLAKLVRTNLTNATPLGSPLLTGSTLPSATSTIAGQTFNWGQGIIAGKTWVTGTNLIAQYQKIYDIGRLLGDGILLSNGLIVSDGHLLSNGMLLGDSILLSNGMLLGDGIPFIPCGMLLGDGILLSNGMVLGDGILLADGMLVGDQSLLGDAASQSNLAQIYGDDSSSMPPLP